MRPCRKLLILAALLLRASMGGGMGEASAAKNNEAQKTSVQDPLEHVSMMAQEAYNRWIQTRNRDDMAVAIKHQEEALKLSPSSWQFHYTLANMYYSIAKEKVAEKYARQAAKLQTGNLQEKLLGRILVQRGKIQEGIPHLQRALELREDDAEGWYKLGGAFFEVGDFVMASKCFHTAGALSNVSLWWLSAAHTMAKLKNPKCFSMYVAAITSDPRNLDAWKDFSYTLSSFHRPKDAEWASRKTLEIEESGDNYFSLGNSLLSQKRYAEARKIYMEGTRMDPQNSGMLHNLGFSSHLSGEPFIAINASLETCKIYLKDGEKGDLTSHTRRQGAMYVTGLANALRRAQEIDLSVAVLRSLRQPKPGAVPLPSVERHVNDKQVINDNIRVDDAELKSSVHKVQKRLKRIRQNLSKQGNDSSFSSQYTGEINVTMDPPPGKRALVPRAVIIYLIGKKIEHYLDLLDSIHSLKINFLDENPYPIILFHEGLNQTQMEAVLKHYDDIRFHRLDKEFLFPPEHVNFSKVPKIIGGHANVGYRHMCRFYSGAMFNYPLLEPYEWFWRLDSDSFILGRIREDPFKVMRSGRYIYGYMGIGREDEYLTIGLWNASQEYMKQKKIVPEETALDRYLEEGKYERTFKHVQEGIGHLPFFRSDKYQSFYSHLDGYLVLRSTALSHARGRKGGFYYYRWGDAPIRLLGVTMHADEGMIRRFHEIPYSHKVYVILP
eukprot:767408-Hanusia_phi.AAC.4